MKTKITYIAFDNTEFSNKEDCELYEERNFNPYSDTLFIYDEDEKRINNTKRIDIYYGAAYIVCKDEKAFEYVNEIFDTWGIGQFIIPFSSYPISLVYDDITERWTTTEHLIETLQSQINKLKKYLPEKEN